MASPRKQLLVRNDRLGDAILALPAYDLLRKSYPEDKIYLWVAPSFAPIANVIEGVEDIIVSGDFDHTEILEKLKSLKIDIAYCLRPTLSNVIALYKAKIKVRVGTARRWYSFLFTKRVNISRRSSDLHEAELNLALLRAMGIDGYGDYPVINIPQFSIDQAESLLNSANINSKRCYIIVHPGSGGSSRDWPLMYYKRLVEILTNEFDIPCIITGSEAEFEKCKEVVSNPEYNFCGKTDTLTLAALLKSARLVISNSTGPLHLATLMKTPVIGLYPPIKDCLPSRWGPYKHPEMAIVPELSLCRKCRPGMVSNCYCMEQIPVDLVVNRALEYCL